MAGVMIAVPASVRAEVCCDEISHRPSRQKEGSREGAKTAKGDMLLDQGFAVSRLHPYDPLEGDGDV